MFHFRNIASAGLLAGALFTLAAAPRLAHLFQGGDTYGLALRQPLPEIVLSDAHNQPFPVSNLAGAPFYVYFG